MDRQHQLTRRRALGGRAFGAGWLALMKASPSGMLGPKRDRLKNPKLVRPPASMPEGEAFLLSLIHISEPTRPY